ncbi:MAG: DUF3047 domain-containing protein [Pseudomonadota bacterium]
MIRRIAKTICLFVAVTFNIDAGANTHEEFEKRVKRHLALVGSKAIAAIKVIYLSGDVGPWVDTGMPVERGDLITTYAEGQQVLSYAFNLSFEADLAVWKRIGSGTEVFRGPAAHTFNAENNGSLELKLYPAVRWLGEEGEYDGEPPLNSLDSGGGVSILVVKWNPGTNVAQEMNKIVSNDNSIWAKVVIANVMEGPASAPKGWHFLHELGPSKIWSEEAKPGGSNAPSRAINAQINNDVSIITYGIDVRLTENTTLNWTWKMDQIPGVMAENTALSHDYLSIAIAFDNGQDLTYYWSKEMNAGEHYACPLPGWSFRETHIVARSGAAGLGEWISEEKSILKDYKMAVGGKLPERVTGVWLIGVGIFKKVQGAGAFGDIRLVDGESELKVY